MTMQQQTEKPVAWISDAMLEVLQRGKTPLYTAAQLSAAEQRGYERGITYSAGKVRELVGLAIRELSASAWYQDGMMAAESLMNTLTELNALAAFKASA